MKSCVGTGILVLTSTVVCPRNTLSSRSIIGTLNPPVPTKIRGSFLRPESTYATEGGALTYIQRKRITKRITTPAIMPNNAKLFIVKIVLKS
jgi:hypothetical protein